MEAPVCCSACSKPSTTTILTRSRRVSTPTTTAINPRTPTARSGGGSKCARTGREFLGGVPDLEAELKRWTANGDEVWTEWEWRGTRSDSGPWVMRGVTIQGLRGDALAWMRLYMEPVEESGAGIEQAVTHLVSGRRVA